MKVVMAGVCVVAMLVSANNVEAKKGYAGVKGGVNIASLSGDGTDDLGSRTGLDAGVFYGMSVNDRFGVRLEGLYVQKGAEGPFVTPGDDHAHEAIVKLDYVELPLLVTASFPAGDKLGFELFAGPTFAFNTTAEVEETSHDETVDISDFTESFELGGAIGGGIEYMLSSFSIIADVRYSIGFSNIVKEFEGDLKNRGIGIMGGFKFPLGGE